MDESKLYDLEGEVIDPNELSIQNCISVKQLIADEDYLYFELIQCKKDDSGNEYLVFDVEPSIPQKPKIDIRKRERIGVKFLVNEDGKPETYAIRKDFPHAPHINYSPEGTPKNLCLSIHLFEEEKVRWTAAKHLSRIHRWLSDTSKDQLHLADQPLENVFYGTSNRIILPSSFFDLENKVDEEVLDFIPFQNYKGHFVLVGLNKALAEKWYGNIIAPFWAFTIDAPKSFTHGIIEYQPTNLYDLDDYLNEFGVSLISELKSKFYSVDGEGLIGKLLLVIRIPKKRFNDDDIEEYEILSFFSDIEVSDLSYGLGVFKKNGKHYNVALNHAISTNAKGIKLDQLNPSSLLTAEKASLYSNLDTKDDKKLTAIGVGAIGSQVILNTIRAGQGKWHLVDKDDFLPHNASRHALPSAFIGMPKAIGMKAFIERIFFEDKLATAQVLDVLTDNDEEFEEHLKSSDFIVDYSASVDVARRMALDFESDVPRVSFFLNPSGKDSVLLAESTDRSCSLDTLEMEYYKSLYSIPGLEGHLSVEDEKIRYAQGCNDISSRIPQYLVAIHAGIGSKEIIDILSDHDDPKIKIWRITESLDVKKKEIKPSRYKEGSDNHWQLKASLELLNKIDEERKNKLPNETGGVLIGSIDHFRKIVYAVDSISSPSDSDEWPYAYIRGVEGLKKRLECIGEKTAGNLQYLGEWHSHPEGAVLDPSEDDKNLFQWLEGYMKLESLPPIMAIIGNNQSSWYISRLEESIDFEI